MLNSNNDIVSIIVPVFNVEKYLDRCICSIQNQTFTNIEIILVDDGSTDKSGKICDNYANNDKRIKVIHKSNGGLSDARNEGIKLSSGKWLAFIDGDDFVAKDTILNLYSASIKNNCKIAICNIIRYYEDCSTEIMYRSPKSEIILSNNTKFSSLSQPSVCNKLFSKTLFENIEFPVGKYYEDTFIYHELVFNANKIVQIDYDGYFYFYRTNSILNTSKNNDKYFDFVEAVYKRMLFLNKNNIDNFATEACLSLYAAYSIAIKTIKKTAKNKSKFSCAKQWFEFAYKNLIKKEEINLKQKIRLILLKYLPYIHKIIY